MIDRRRTHLPFHQTSPVNVPKEISPQALVEPVRRRVAAAHTAPWPAGGAFGRRGADRALERARHRTLPPIACSSSGRSSSRNEMRQASVSKSTLLIGLQHFTYSINNRTGIHRTFNPVECSSSRASATAAVAVAPGTKCGGCAYQINATRRYQACSRAPYCLKKDNPSSKATPN